MCDLSDWVGNWIFWSSPFFNPKKYFPTRTYERTNSILYMSRCKSGNYFQGGWKDSNIRYPTIPRCSSRYKVYCKNVTGKWYLFGRIRRIFFPFFSWIAPTVCLNSSTVSKVVHTSGVLKYSFLLSRHLSELRETIVQCEFFSPPVKHNARTTGTTHTRISH